MTFIESLDARSRKVKPSYGMVTVLTTVLFCTLMQKVWCGSEVVDDVFVREKVGGLVKRVYWCKF